VRRHWASRRPTVRADVQALARLAGSAELHRQLSAVRAFRSLITGGKRVLKTVLPREWATALKDRRGMSGGGEGSAPSGMSWPDEGRLTRECMRVAFSNERARALLGWSPRYDLPTGAAMTRTWLEAANLLTAEP
jgi:nucleoside-diphosphate-sugar epimerase